MQRLLLSRDDLSDLGITYSKVTLWRMVRSGKFPAPTKTGSNPRARNYWLASEVEAWLASRVADRDAKRPPGRQAAPAAEAAA